MSLPKLAPLIRPVPTVRVRSIGSGTSRPDAAWAIVGEIGAALALVGGVDLALSWYPLAFGNPEWEFGTVTTTLDGMPALAIGLGMALGSVVFLGKRRLGRGIAATFALLGIALLAMAVLYVTTLPIAWRSVNDAMLQQGLLKAITKTLVQALVYPAVFLGIAVQGWRSTSAPPPPPDL
jgi:peptidoglycan/LPS O-acetylase OafA/YrhL